MPFNGSNTFTIVNTFVPATTILSSAVNANFSDIATGLSDCVTRDAQGAVTGNLLFSSTGFLQLPNGTSVQRPSSPVAGYARYNTTNNEFEYYNGTTWGGGIVPIGGLVPYTGSTAPNTSFVIPVGQAISRTTYATYFSLVSTTYGIGDGSSTFNVPDLRGRTPFQVDSGGSGRITVAGGNFDGTVLGNSGGGQNHTLTIGEMPSHNHTVTDTHTHTYNDPNVGGANTKSGTLSGGNATNTSATTGGSISINNAGSGNPHTILNPCLMINYILRVI